MKNLFLLLLAYSVFSFASNNHVDYYQCVDVEGKKYRISFEPVFGPAPLPQPVPFPTPNSGDRSVGSLEAEKENNVYIYDIRENKTRVDILLNFIFDENTYADTITAVFQNKMTNKVYSCVKSKVIHAPNPGYDQQYGQILPYMAIGAETTGIGMKLPNGELIEITGTTQEITNQLFEFMAERRSIHIEGFWGVQEGPERGEYDVLFVHNYFLD